MVAQLPRDILDAVFECEAQVTCAQPLVRPVVDLELSGAIFAVGGDNVDADLRHQFDDTLCYRHSRVAHMVEDVQAVEDRLHSSWIEQVKFVCEPNHCLVAEFVEFRDCPAQYMTRCGV